MTELENDDENLLRYGAEETFTNKGWRELEKDIQHLLKVLQAKPEDSRSLSDVHFEGRVFRTKSRKPDWVEMFAELDGDMLRFRRLDGKFKGECRICYVFMTRITKEDDLIDLTGLKLRQRIIIISQDDVIHMALESEDDLKMWLDVLKKLLRAKYSKRELAEKEEAKKDLQPLLVEQESMKMKRFKMIVDTLKESGFFISPKIKKEREGHLDLQRRGKEWKTLYVVLFKDYLYMFKPHAKVTLDSQPYDWIDLAYVTGLRPSREKKDCFVIFTAMRKFVFRAKHEIAVSEWVNAINDATSRKNASPMPAAPITVGTDRKGYSYSKSVDDRMSLILDCPDMDKPKMKKLPKATEHTIGRSSSASVVIKEDKWISRSHCRIVVEDNVPFLVDLGTSTGTKLNGHRITKAPLKPGDVIEIGKSKITFEVKDAFSIFHVDEEIAALNEAAAKVASSATKSEEAAASPSSPKRSGSGSSRSTKSKDSRESKEPKEPKEPKDSKRESNSGSNKPTSPARERKSKKKSSGDKGPVDLDDVFL